jgi:hypothetical protein
VKHLLLSLPGLCILPCVTALAAAPVPESNHALPSRLHYRSALQGFQAYTEPALQPWREANDTVGRIGGWRNYAQEASTESAVADHPPHGDAAAQPAGEAP